MTITGLQNAAQVGSVHVGANLDTPPLSDLHDALMRILHRSNSLGWQAGRIADAAYGPVPSTAELAKDCPPESLYSAIAEIELSMDRIGANLNRMNGGR